METVDGNLRFVVAWRMQETFSHFVYVGRTFKEEVSVRDPSKTETSHGAFTPLVDPYPLTLLIVEDRIFGSYQNLIY